MAHSQDPGGAHAPLQQPSTTTSTNNGHAAGLSNNSTTNVAKPANARLSLNPNARSSSAAPPSPRITTNRRASEQFAASSPASRKPPPSPLRRSSSVMDIDRDAPSPNLRKKTSSSSLRNDDIPGTPMRSSSRRSSAYMLSSSPVSSTVQLPPPIEEPPALTAATVAAEYFQKELLRHTEAHTADGPETVVILHDSCYGHRFSRPKTTKTTLSLIVERPERILAGALGVSSAYIRLGEHHEGGREAPHPARDPTSRIPFRIKRTRRTVDITSPVVTNVHGLKWMEELKTMCESAAHKLATTGKELARPDAQAGPGRPVKEKEKFHEGDLYLCPESLNAFQGALGGVLDGVDAVFEGTKAEHGPSRSFVCIRPPGHHCSADYPSGFCWINNVHVGIQHAALAHGLSHAAIIDFDLHHGDGSQTITWNHNTAVQKLPKSAAMSRRAAIGYFSIHDINSYPCEYGDIEKVQNASLCIENAHGQSVWNVHLQPWKTEADFWRLYETRYVTLLEKTRAFLRTHFERLQSGSNQPTPKSAIFISAGFDASEWESQGMQRHKVNVPTEFYARFTRDIVRLAQEDGTGANGRVISVLEGGYSDRALTSGVLSHISGLCEGQRTLKPQQLPTNGLGYEMAQQMAQLDIADTQETAQEPESVRYNVAWWHEDNLATLEELVNPTPVATAPKKAPRTGAPPAYYSPTQSFSAKVVDPSKIRRSTSGAHKSMSASPSRAPTPPPPEVDWATAAHELSKLLIPTDRQTTSCKAEDLNEPRMKKEKVPKVAVPTAPTENGRQLRGRKAAKPGRYADPDTDDDAASTRSVSTSDRRKTIAVLPSSTSGTATDTNRRASRRLSVASSVGSVSGDKPTPRVPNGTTAAPKSTVSSRAPSAAPTSSTVAVRKPRTSAPAATDTKTSRPTVPRFSSSSVAKGTVAASKTTDTKPKEKGSVDVDALTKGLKKITLKLPPQEEYEAKQKEKLTAEKKEKKPLGRPPTKKPTSAKGPKSTIKPIEKTDAPAVQTVAPAPAGGSNLMSTTDGVVETQQMSNDQSAAVRSPSGIDSVANGLQQAQTSGFTVAIPTTAPMRQQESPVPSQDATEPQFVYYQPDTAEYRSEAAGMTMDLTASQKPLSLPGTDIQSAQAGLQWMTPNSDIPLSPISPAHMNATAPNTMATQSSHLPTQHKSRLPTFTANGAIPFGSGGGVVKQETPQQQQSETQPNTQP